MNQEQIEPSIRQAILNNKDYFNKEVEKYKIVPWSDLMDWATNGVPA